MLFHGATMMWHGQRRSLCCFLESVSRFLLSPPHCWVGWRCAGGEMEGGGTKVGVYGGEEEGSGSR